MNSNVADGIIIGAMAGTVVYTTVERVVKDSQSRGPSMTVVIGGVLVTIPLLILADFEPGLAAALAALILLGSVINGGEVLQVAANVIALKPGDVTIGKDAQPSLETTLPHSLGKSVPITGGSGSGAAAVAAAATFLGVPYGQGPGQVDCSLLMQKAYALINVPIGRDTFTQVQQGTAVSYGNMQPGDLIFEKGISPVTGKLVDFGHVVMYVGDGKVIQAQKHGTNVMYTPVPSAAQAQAIRRYV